MLNRFIIAVILFTFLACKKDPQNVPSPPKPGPEPSARTKEQKVRDSIYYYYKLYSYWESSIPTYNPISDISDKYSSNNSLLTFLMNQTPVKNDYVFHGPNSPLEDYTGPLDRFSWIENLSSNFGASSRADTYDGFGLFVVFESNAPTAPLYIGMVEGGSPAAVAGFKRGDKVIKMNELSNVTYANYNSVNNELNKSMLTMKVLRNGVEIEKTIENKTYDIFPVVKDSVYTVDNNKVGYFAFSSFEEMTDDSGNYTAMYNAMEKAFNSFGSAGIKKIVVDLRYNTGGYVSTAIYLANKIVNSSGAGKLMFRYDVNKNLKDETNPGGDFADVLFNKRNNTEITDVYFLVSDYTASASEIVISVLKPYAKVYIIGEHGSTYGKPVGFFRQDIMNTAGLWAASFKIVNKDGYTDYWDGIPADKAGVLDNVRFDFGDTRETMLATALAHIKTGSYTLTGASAKASTRVGGSPSSQSVMVNKIPMRNMIKD